MVDNAPPGKWLMEGQRCIICGEGDPALLMDEPLYGGMMYPEDSIGAWWNEWMHLEPGDVINLCIECLYK